MGIRHAVIRATVAMIAMGICYLVGLLFYKHPVPAGVLSFAGLLAVPGFQAYLADRQRREMTGHFRQFLYAFSTSLAAGRSVENAMLAAEKDLRLLIQNEHVLFLRALALVNRKVANGYSVERAFAAFAEHSKIADILAFSEVFLLCKQTGGDLVELIRRSAGLIAEKLEIEQEIEVMTAQKNFEAKAMSVVPFAMIGFLAFGSPDYMAPLYEGLGRLIMTLVLAVLIGCYFWIRTIMRLEV